MSDAWGSPPAGPPPRPGGISQRAVIWIVGIVALVVILLRTHTLHIQRFDVIYICVLIPSIILHEVSHGAVARIFGDDTAQRAGRLTLNPLPHIDPLGSVILPGLLILSHAGVAFGWAKPVPVNVSRLRHPRNDSIWVSLAGPFTNVALFVIAALVFRYSFAHGLFVSPTDTTIPLAYEVLLEAGLANLTLAFFNLLPIPPLDGSVLIERLLPARAQARYFELRPIGMIIVFVVAFFAFQNPSVQTHLLNGELHLWNGVSGTAF